MVHVLRIAMIGIIVLMTGCASLPQPQGNDSSMLAVSASSTRIFGDFHPELLTIIREEDGKVLPFDVNDGEYYFFVNVLPGTYKVNSAVFMKTTTVSRSSGGEDFSVGSSVSMSQENAIPLGDEQIKMTTTSVFPGTVNFMGTITSEGTAKILPPGVIDFSNVLVVNDSSERERALAYIKESFGSSNWVKRLDR